MKGAEKKKIKRNNDVTNRRNEKMTKWSAGSKREVTK